MRTEEIDIGGDTLRFRVTGAQSRGAVLAYDVELAPGGGPPMLHRHDSFEMFRVDAGEIAFYLEDDGGEIRREVAAAGSVVAIPGGREHTVRNESTAPARALAVLSPGADMERFARGVAELPRDDEGTAIDAVMRLAVASGIESTRPVAELG